MKLAENGTNPKTLCELGGWSDPYVLNEYYAKVTDANKDRARQVLDELMGEEGHPFSNQIFNLNSLLCLCYFPSHYPSIFHFITIGLDIFMIEGKLVVVDFFYNVYTCSPLAGHRPGVIKDRKDFEKYPWDMIESLFFDNYSHHFEALRQEIPEGMKAVGGPGNGIFECVQELVGYENLCILSFDDAELYADLLKKVGEVTLFVAGRNTCDGVVPDGRGLDCFEIYFVSGSCQRPSTSRLGRAA